MEAIGSALGGPGGGGLVIAIIYVVLGPGAVAYHSFRLARHAYSRRTRQQATLRPSDFETAKKCLPWNIGISLLPAIPVVLNAFH
jgi:hypothetical protein